MVLILLLSFVAAVLVAVVWFSVKNLNQTVKSEPEQVEAVDEVGLSDEVEPVELFDLPGQTEMSHDSESFQDIPEPQNESLILLGQLFQTRIIDAKAFLDPNFSMQDAARMLNTNRTYISKVVNMQYGASFKELIARLRLDYSKKILLEEPNETMVCVAKKCGFLASNQFIRKFREQEGVTPLVWRSSQM